MTCLCKVSHVCCVQSNCENIFVIYAPHPLILKHNLLNRKPLVDAAEAQTFTHSIAKYVFRYWGFRLLAVTNKARSSVRTIKVASFWYRVIFLVLSKVETILFEFLDLRICCTHLHDLCWMKSLFGLLWKTLLRVFSLFFGLLFLNCDYLQIQLFVSDSLGKESIISSQYIQHSKRSGFFATPWGFATMKRFQIYIFI